MKRKKTILTIVIGIIFAGIIFGISDYARVRNGIMPMFMLAENDKSGPEINYYGLGYKMVRTPGVSYKQDIDSDINVSFGLWFYTWKVDVEKINYTYSLDVKEEKCSEPKLYYEDSEGYKFYTSCIKSIDVNKGKTVSLKNALESKIMEKNDLTNLSTLISVNSNGSLYKMMGEFSNKNLQILKCSNIKKYYIGTENAYFKNSLCEKEKKKFNKTYKVLNISESSNKNYVFVTLREDKIDDVQTVKILKEKVKNLKVNNYYNFVFKEDKVFNNNIQSIFANSILEEVKSITK